MFLTKKDTFVFGPHLEAEVETSTTETIDELFRAGCKVIRTNPKVYLKMHACEEDIKYFLASFRPQYLIPINAHFVKLLACAKIALNMNIGFNHNNVFLLDNGDAVEFESKIGKVLSKKVISGDIFIDGKGIGDVESSVIEERHILADEGVIVLGVTISKSLHKIIAGPDVQARGLVFLKDNENLIKEITRIFVSTIETELVKENYSIVYMETVVKDLIFKAIRRNTNKTPTIIPIITETN